MNGESRPVDAIPSEALERFEQILARARCTALREPTAVTLATAGNDARPSARVVLMRRFDSRGFVFFTNSESRKGEQLAVNPRAALCFYWDELAEQVRVEGEVVIVSADEADEYWSGRPRDSQIGAWASLQSRAMPDRQTLDDRVQHFSAQYSHEAVPRPPHWNGYRVVPERIEFWQNREARLHERLVYLRTAKEWVKMLLYP
jgi:pyridoxamine 5'-phosphate oxidase